MYIMQYVLYVFIYALKGNYPSYHKQETMTGSPGQYVGQIVLSPTPKRVLNSDY